MTKIFLQLHLNGDVIDWGRNATVNGIRGRGGARLYMGEAAKVMRMVLKYSKGEKNNG